MAKKTKAARAVVPTLALQPSTNLPLSQLVLSAANVRSIYDEQGIADLAHSIAQRGLLQSLSVRPIMDENREPTQIYAVQAGGRRFRALQRLVKEGRLSADAEIPCIIKTTGLAEDDSLAENADRAPLHPLDEFKAFAAMLDNGRSIDDIAAAYRVTPTVVRQRLRLASASPVILEAFAKDEIDLAQLMAFCLTDNHARQETVWASIKGGNQNDEPWHIKKLLTENTVDVTDVRARFVGIDAYTKAGGIILRDLFDDEDEGYLTDPDLLTQLFDQKLAALQAEYRAKGWKWAIAAQSIPYAQKQSLDRLTPFEVELTDAERAQIAKLEEERDALSDLEELTDEQQARLDAVEAELEAFENRPPVFAPEDMARAGVFISVNYAGDVQVDYGFVRPEDALTAQDDADDGESSTTEPDRVDDEETEHPGKPLSDRLVQDLTGYRTIALRNAVANDYAVAFVAVLHAMVAQRFYHRGTLSCLQLTLRTEFPAQAPGLDTWPATKLHDAQTLAWKQRLPKEVDKLWEALSAMSDSDRKALFAHCAASAINCVQLRSSAAARSSDLRHADQLASSVGLSMGAAGWSATQDSYLGRVTKAHVLEAVTEAKGAETANLIAHLKKDDMAKEAERLLLGTGWVPAILRTPHQTAPAPVVEELPEFLRTDEEPINVAAA
jgi:ParB family chromosome partitioning protein